MGTAWVDRIAAAVADPDPVAANRAITALYLDLARAVHAELGGPDSNWLTFGYWASASAGRFIRGEGLPFPVGRESVAAGNRAIMADIGPRFARWLESRPARDAADDREDTDPLLSSPPVLAEAFSCYDAVATLPADDPRRAQLMLRANVLVAHHEQDLADVFVDRAMPLGGPFGILTTRFVQLHVPDGALDVSRDVPPPRYLGGARWPADLDRLTDARLIALARRYRQPLDGRLSAATSWEDFDERMGFILCFFRAYQQDPSLRV